jgi:hypothetical protein
MNETMAVSQTAAGSPGAAKLVEHWRQRTVQVAALAGGTLQLQGSIDGTNYGQIGADITADGLYSVVDANGFEMTVRFLRIATTVDTGGSTVVSIAGLHTRTDGG